MRKAYRVIQAVLNDEGNYYTVSYSFDDRGLAVGKIKHLHSVDLKELETIGRVEDSYVEGNAGYVITVITDPSIQRSVSLEETRIY